MGSTTSAPAAPESDAQSSSSPVDEVQDRDFSPIVSVGVWSRLNAFGRFHNDGIEAAFRVYAATEWAASFPRWILATAIAFTVTPIFDIFTLILGSPEGAWAPHSSLRPTFYSIAVLMWLATFGLRFLVPSDFLERCAKYQQPIIIAVTGGAACGVTFPVIMMSADLKRRAFLGLLSPATAHEQDRRFTHNDGPCREERYAHARSLGARCVLCLSVWL